MRVFKTRWFARFSKAERIGDKLLAEAISNAERGLIDADLGGGLIKLRVARPGKGKSGGWAHPGRVPQRPARRIRVRVRQERPG